MFGRLFPRETNFFDFFEKHAALAALSAQEFVEGKRVEEAAKRIKVIEHEADEITHRCIEALHKTFITPIERHDIHRLISRQDDIVDLLDGAVRRMVLFEVQIMNAEIGEMGQCLIRATQTLERTVKGLRNMKAARAVMDECIKIHEIENIMDGLNSRTVAKLYKGERDPLTVMKWREIYDILESAVDRCEDVANIVEGIVLEHA